MCIYIIAAPWTNGLQSHEYVNIISTEMKTVDTRKPVRSKPPKRRDRSPATSDGQDREQLASLVCNHFCRGLRVSQILAELKREHGIDLTREQPYEILRWAAENG